MTVPTHPPILNQEDRARLGRRARLLAGASVTYNGVEAVIAIAAGAAAGSVALVGFGLDSVVEMSSGLVILWQFRHRLSEARERQALRFIGVSFLLPAAYVSFESLRSLLGSGEADASPAGIGNACRGDAVPVVGATSHRSLARVGQCGSGLHPDAALHVPEPDPVARTSDL